MADYLQTGFPVGPYEIGRVLRRDGVSVEYEALDSGRNESVIVKEFLPDGLAHRHDGAEVGVRAPAEKPLFDAGLARFLAQYRTLARIAHPAIVKVRECLPANGTGYAVLDYPQGRSLAARLDNGKRLPERELVRVFGPVLDGLEVVHRANHLHRQISIENVLIDEHDLPLLVGFGSATAPTAGPRPAFGPRASGFIGLLTPGYAALEQYSLRGQLGPWTDIYALGATLYRCTTGIVPADAPGRAVQDDLIAAVRAATGAYDSLTLAGIDAALALRVTARPRSIGAWRARMPALGEPRPVSIATRGRLAARQFQGPAPATLQRGHPSNRTRTRVRSARPSTAAAQGVRSARVMKPTRHRSNWAVPALGATLLISLLTWLDAGLLRSTVQDHASEELSEPMATIDARPQTATDSSDLHRVTGESPVAPWRDETGLTPVSETAPATDPISESARPAGGNPVRSVPLFAASGKGDRVDSTPIEPSGQPPTPGSPALASTPRTHPFSITTVPADATVRFDAQGAAYEPEMQLPPGNHRVVVSLPGYETWEGVVRHGAEPTDHQVALTELQREFADRLTSGDTGPTMVVIPPGANRIGCLTGKECFDNELPPSQTEIDRPIALSKYEITFDDYDRFTRATGRRRAESPENWDRRVWPVVSVTWDDAAAYARWLSAETGRNYRLPTETEWEYAARAQATTAYSWGEDAGDGLANCSDCSAAATEQGTVNVGTFAANPWGLHDVHGNVWEWVADCAGAWPSTTERSSIARAFDGDCNRRVRRGGSWAHTAQRMRFSVRDVTTAGLRSLDTGFRVLLQIE